MDGRARPDRLRACQMGGEGPSRASDRVPARGRHVAGCRIRTRPRLQCAAVRKPSAPHTTYTRGERSADTAGRREVRTPAHDRGAQRAARLHGAALRGVSQGVPEGSLATCMGRETVEASRDMKVSETRRHTCGCCGTVMRVVNGKWLRARRIKADATMRFMAKLADCSAAHINDIEHNRRTCPPNVERAYRDLDVDI